jgi:uncharacterized protein (TIGR02453 family)
MLEKSTFKFLRQLVKNNNREWFAAKRSLYEAAKADFEKLVEEIIAALIKVDSKFTGLTVQNSVYRIYRDVRFSPDKSPYKSNFAASINAGGRKSGNAGMYFQIDPTGEWGSFIAGGMWMPSAEKLKAIRQEIEYNTDEFRQILSNKEFKKWFGGLEDQKLKTIPRGYDKNDPDIELYKYTSYLISHQFDEEEFYSDDIVKKIIQSYKLMQPLLNFLNRAVAD